MLGMKVTITAATDLMAVLNNIAAAPRFEEQFPENTSEYAEEGRLAHAICELKIIKHFTTQIKPRTYTQGLKS